MSSKLHDVHGGAGGDTMPVSSSRRHAMEAHADALAERIDAAPLPAIAGDGVGANGALEPELLRHMEQHFDHDFGRVRVHTDAEAARSAAGYRAAAYTVGDDIVFNAGAFAPRSRAGRRLLAHELAHVVQQAQMPMPFVQCQSLLGGAASDDAKAALLWESHRQALTLAGFDSDQAALKPEHVAALDQYKLRVQMLLGRYPDSFFSIIGHTDATDSEAHNENLGQQRAAAVKDYLAGGDNAIPARILTAGSLGESALAVDTPGREARNRRVEILPTLRRPSIRFPAPTPTPPLTGGFGGIGPGPGRGAYPGVDPDPYGMRGPKIPGVVLPRHDWLEDALDRDPLIRSLPKWMGDKVKDALKDADEKLAEKVIDALPLDDKTKAAVQAIAKSLLQMAKGKKFEMPEAPPRGPDFGPQPQLPTFPGEVIIPGPKFEF